MSNYTDKVNERARELAALYFMGFIEADEIDITAFLPLAVLSVQREADAARAVLDNYLTDEKVIEIYLQSQGLIETT